MTDDEKTAESAAGLLIPEPSERRDSIEQIRERHAGVHFVHPVNLAECDCSTCALLAEIDRLQAQLGAVVEECAVISCDLCRSGQVPTYSFVTASWLHGVGQVYCPGTKYRKLHPSATKALERRVLDARREEAAHWHDSPELSAGCFVGICPGCTRVAEIDAQLAALNKDNPRP